VPPEEITYVTGLQMRRLERLPVTWQQAEGSPR
jgi:hypothetical protein